MRKNPKTLLCLVALAALLLMSAPASATPLAPGGTAVASPAAGFFSIAADTGPLAFNFAGNTGSVEEWAGTFTGNTIPGGGESFLYQFTVTAGSGIGRLSGASYAGWVTDVQQAAGSGPFGVGTDASFNVTRSADGSAVGFNFNPEAAPGTTSFALVINTNAPGFTTGTIGMIDGGGQTLPGFAPAPEPASMILFSTTFACLGGGALIRRFKSRKAIA